jgi:hypothetical protein
MSSFEWESFLFFNFLGVNSSNYVNIIEVDEGFDAEKVLLAIDFDLILY